jgi:hypothetical protein
MTFEIKKFIEIPTATVLYIVAGEKTHATTSNDDRKQETSQRKIKAK